MRQDMEFSIPGRPEQVLERCRDPEVARARAASDPTLAAEVTELGGPVDGGAFLVYAVTGRLPESWIPARVAAAMPAQVQVSRREAWFLADDGGAHAQVDIDLGAIPATRIRAAARLAPRGPQDSALIYRLDLDVSVPLLGSAIERAVLGRLAAALEREAEVIRGA